MKQEMKALIPILYVSSLQQALLLIARRKAAQMVEVAAEAAAGDLSRA